MKLIFCFSCEDVVRLKRTERHCSCGKSSGAYKDNLNAWIKGDCMPLGFANASFVRALRMQQLEDKHQINKTDVCCEGIHFEAFTIPSWAKSIKRIDNDNAGKR